MHKTLAELAVLVEGEVVGDKNDTSEPAKSESGKPEPKGAEPDKVETSDETPADAAPKK